MFIRTSDTLRRASGYSERLLSFSRLRGRLILITIVSSASALSVFNLLQLAIELSSTLLVMSIVSATAASNLRSFLFLLGLFFLVVTLIHSEVHFGIIFVLLREATDEVVACFGELKIVPDLHGLYLQFGNIRVRDGVLVDSFLPVQQLQLSLTPLLLE